MPVSPQIIKSIESVPIDRRRVVNYDRSTALTLYPTDLFKTHCINATGNFDLTLPTASYGDSVNIVNVGASTITVKDSATTLATLTTDQYVQIIALGTSSNTAQWPDAVPVWDVDGTLTTVANIIVDSTTKGFVLKSTDGHYWSFAVNTSGALVSTDNGLTPPV